MTVKVTEGLQTHSATVLWGCQYKPHTHTQWAIGNMENSIVQNKANVRLSYDDEANLL